MTTEDRSRDQQFQLEREEISVYLLALRRDSLGDTGTVAAELGLRRAGVEAAVHRLVALHLLRYEGSRIVPVNPEIAAAAIISPVEREIEQRRAMISTVRDQMGQMLWHYTQSPRRQGSIENIEKLAGPSEIGGALAVAANDCKEEVLSIQSGDRLAHPVHDDLFELGRGLLGRSVRCRLLYPHGARVKMSAKGRIKQLIEAGAEIRTHHQVPKELMIFDRRWAFLFHGSKRPDDHGSKRPDDHGNEGPDEGAILISSPDVVRYLCDVFEHVWQSASDYKAAKAGYDGVADDVQLAIARMLAEGVTDEVVARRLGISVRACRRHIAALFRNLDSVSRFQAGTRAASAGLVPAS